MEDARAMDEVAVRDHGQTDRCHHWCAEQRSQQQAGYMEISIEMNIFGFVVRDTNNNGAGSMYGGRHYPDCSAAGAIEFARKWYLQAPDRRDVTIGFVTGDGPHAELARALSEASDLKKKDA